jgi:predicted nucleotidyltransferase
MTNTLYDFSQTPELAPLAAVVRSLQAVAQPLATDFFLMGAAARDVMLRHAHSIDTGRKTEDVDFAVMVYDWNAFLALRAALVQGGDFSERPGPATHRLRHASGLPLDIVPFGGIERADRTIAWPPDQTTVFDCFGVKEAFKAAVQVLLPGVVRLSVAPIPALALLKVTAWQDRKYAAPGRDAPDLLLYLGHYMDCKNLDRAAAEHPDLFDDTNYDHQAAGARLLGRDMAAMLGTPAVARTLAILMAETDAKGSLLLARQSGLALETARRLLAALCAGLQDALPETK